MKEKKKSAKENMKGERGEGEDSRIVRTTNSSAAGWGGERLGMVGKKRKEPKGSKRKPR